MQFASYFDPKTVINGDINSISDALTLFPYLQLDIEKLDLEYRLLAETEEVKKIIDYDVVTFWYNVSTLKNALNENLFPNVTKLIHVLLALPHSSAAAERIFSQLTLIKVKTRNRLLVRTCILTISPLLSQRTINFLPLRIEPLTNPQTHKINSLSLNSQVTNQV